MKILMLAWRDMKNPLKGGAEIVTDIYLKALVKSGNQVTLFTSKYNNSTPEETYNGYKIIRNGSGLTVCMHGLAYATKNKKNFDIIIDQINTIPFFTPLTITKTKRIAFFHQLCKEIWFYEKSFPVSIIGYALESIYLKLYRNTRAIAVSNSTKNDLIRYCGINPEKNEILVLENQIDFKPIKKPVKKENYFIFCGRLTASKRVHDCIKALSLISNNQNIVNNIDNKKESGKVRDLAQNPSASHNSLHSANINNKNINNKINKKSNNFNKSQTKLIIVGNGNKEYIKYLEDLTNKLNLKDRVIFKHNLNNNQRNKLMQKALAILVTSVKEGWGLIVTEANANGTLAITYNTDGLVDANQTGFITNDKSHNIPQELAHLMNITIDSKELTAKMSKKSIDFAKSHCDWSKNTRRLEQWLKN